MASNPQTAADYALGSSQREHQRLVYQANILRPWTERFFRAAGLAPGMRVLDLGCGMGDVSLLAASLVGLGGSVVGIDRDPAVIHQARERAARESCSDRVSFHASDLLEYRDSHPFDAVVGRYILLYQPDPAAALRWAASALRPGGILAFHEVDFGRPPIVHPHAPLWHQTYLLLAESFRRCGAPADFGLRLTRTFLDAELPWPTVQAEMPAGGEPGSYLYRWIAGTIASLLPRIEQFGLATREEIQIETLAERLEAEGVALGAQILGPTQFGAWTQIPGNC